MFNRGAKNIEKTFIIKLGMWPIATDLAGFRRWMAFKMSTSETKVNDASAWRRSNSCAVTKHN